MLWSILTNFYLEKIQPMPFGGKNMEKGKRKRRCKRKFENLKKGRNMKNMKDKRTKVCWRWGKKYCFACTKI
jgi:hypothetical protein